MLSNLARRYAVRSKAAYGLGNQYVSIGRGFASKKKDKKDKNEKVEKMEKNPKQNMRLEPVPPAVQTPRVSPPFDEVDYEDFEENYGMNDYVDTPFGHNLFDRAQMQDHVHPETLREYDNSISEGRAMSKDHADQLAEAMWMWAETRGAKSFAHWASPVRGPNNLLKHDTFLAMDFKSMTITQEFTGSRLFFNETDGSSFPNGGLRDTHSAAAYVTWDKLSPPFVKNETLYIPSAFISWTGDALDEKIPLLRSQEAVDKAGLRLIRHLGEKEGTGVVCNVGWEQEFFLIDRATYLSRPDLVACGRTLFGAAPPRGQQTDQNYFTQVPPRVKQVLEDVQARLHGLGVALSVYHSEVAPSQYEFSPIFSLVNSAADGNVLSMEVLQEVAQQHDMIALFHEKPFAGINGSGKHSNWGLNVRGTGRNLMVPGKTKEHQASFMAMVACMLRTVHLHGDIIRASVASAGNDHRLGAQEAPPAIMSLYLGKNLGEHCEKIASGEGELAGYGLGEKMVTFGSRCLQPIKVASEDRNRTAPFPFCGNRFEFRAVGSDFHIGFPLTVIQAAMAESMDAMSDELEKGKDLKTVVREFFNKHLTAMFNGDGYSSEWQDVESKKRGLENLRTTVDALEVYSKSKNVDLFTSTEVFRPEEVHARQEIHLEKYVRVILIEANCMLDMMETGVLPACAQDLQGYSTTTLAGERVELYNALRGYVSELADKIDQFPHSDDAMKQARYALEVIKPAMELVRIEADQAERLVRNDLWPFPTYHEIFFHHQSQSRLEEQQPVQMPSEPQY